MKEYLSLPVGRRLPEPNDLPGVLDFSVEDQEAEFLGCKLRGCPRLLHIGRPDLGSVGISCVLWPCASLLLLPEVHPFWNILVLFGVPHF